jgi:protein involved in polysaccharide export with SLBB domain
LPSPVEIGRPAAGRRRVAAGLTPEELQQKLVGTCATQITTKEVTVALQSSAFPVFVTGSVIRPGKILSDHPITTLEAVAEVCDGRTVSHLCRQALELNEDSSGRRSSPLKA